VKLINKAKMYISVCNYKKSQNQEPKTMLKIMDLMKK